MIRFSERRTVDENHGVIQRRYLHFVQRTQHEMHLRSTHQITEAQ
jgi:hypothetical protein